MREKQLQKQQRKNSCKTVTRMRLEWMSMLFVRCTSTSTYSTHVFHSNRYSKMLNKKRQQRKKQINKTRCRWRRIWDGFYARKNAHSTSYTLLHCVMCVQMHIIWSFILWIAGRIFCILISFSYSLLTLSFEMILHRCAISSLDFRSILSPLNVCINFVPSISFLPVLRSDYHHFGTKFDVHFTYTFKLYSSSDFAINLSTLHSTRSVYISAWQTDSTIVINLLYSFHFIWRRAANVAKSYENWCDNTQTHARIR